MSSLLGDESSTLRLKKRRLWIIFPKKGWGLERENSRRESQRDQQLFIPITLHLISQPPHVFFFLGQSRSFTQSLIQAQIRRILTTISALITHHTSSSYVPDPNPEPLLLAVGMHQPLSPRLELPDEAWDDLGRECGGWEWVDGEKEDGGKNEFGGTFLSALLLALCFSALQPRTFEFKGGKKGTDWCSAEESPCAPPTSFFTVLRVSKINY